MLTTIHTSAARPTIARHQSVPRIAPPSDIGVLSDVNVGPRSNRRLMPGRSNVTKPAGSSISGSAGSPSTNPMVSRPLLGLVDRLTDLARPVEHPLPERSVLEHEHRIVGPRPAIDELVDRRPVHLVVVDGATGRERAGYRGRSATTAPATSTSGVVSREKTVGVAVARFITTTYSSICSRV